MGLRHISSAVAVNSFGSLETGPVAPTLVFGLVISGALACGLSAGGLSVGGLPPMTGRLLAGGLLAGGLLPMMLGLEQALSNKTRLIAGRLVKTGGRLKLKGFPPDTETDSRSHSSILRLTKLSLTTESQATEQTMEQATKTR